MNTDDNNSSQHEQQVVSSEALPAIAIISTQEDALDSSLNEGDRISEIPENTDLSDGEGDIEIEHLGPGYEHRIDLPLSSQNQVTVDVRKRTIIYAWQKVILEDYYCAGMTSASMQIHDQHLGASEKTGLDLTVIKNWIRNRRRPSSVKSSAEFMAHKNLQSDIPQISMPSITSIPTYSTTVAPILNEPVTPITHHLQSTSQPKTMVNPIPTIGLSMTLQSALSTSLGPPETKKPRIEPCYQAITSSTPTRPPLHPPHTFHPTLQSPSASVYTNLLVKVRISDSGDSDFIEVEVPSPTYQSLLTSVCDELEVAPTDVTKIRKLPNILIRKDKDVQRLREGQELEVILNQTHLNHAPRGATSTVSSLGRGEVDRSMLAVPTITLQNLPGGHISSQQVNGSR